MTRRLLPGGASVGVVLFMWTLWLPPALAAEPDSATQPADAKTAATNDAPSPLSQHEADAGVWRDHADARLVMARGTLTVCEDAMLPIAIIPVAGQIVASVVEWFCVAPAILAVDYVETFHGRRHTQVWQSALALLAMKGVRDVVRLSSWIGVLVVGVVLFLAISPAFVFLPILSAFSLTTMGVCLGASYVLLSVLQDMGSDAMFEFVFEQVTSPLTPDARAQLRRESIVQLPLDPPVRFWRNMALVSGTDPAFSWWHLVPVYGAWKKAQDRGDALKINIRRFVATEAQTRALDLTGTEASIGAFASVSGIAGAIGQSAAIAGAGLYLLDRRFFVGDQVDVVPQSFPGFVGAGLLGVAAGAFTVQIGARMVRTVWIPTALAATPSGPAAGGEE